MKVLRNLRESTRLFFLYEITENRHSRLRTIAEPLGMTVQGASHYAAGLEEDGLLTFADGEYRATKKGVEFLHAELRELRSFVERAAKSMAFVEVTTALAGGPIRRGDRVGLFMERGQLVAYVGRPSPSTGVAVQDAGRGEDVAVRNLEGIVALRPGRIVIVRLPPAQRGGPRAVSEASSRRLARGSRASSSQLSTLPAWSSRESSASSRAFSLASFRQRLMRRSGGSTCCCSRRKRGLRR